MWQDVHDMSAPSTRLGVSVCQWPVVGRNETTCSSRKWYLYRHLHVFSMQKQLWWVTLWSATHGVWMKIIYGVRYHGHLWPYHPVTCDPILPGHLGPYYPVTCDPIPLITLTPPAFHQTMVSNSTSLFELPPLRSTKPWSLFYFFIWTSPPCVPLNHCLHSTSLFKLPPLRSTKPWSPFYFFI